MKKILCLHGAGGCKESNYKLKSEFDFMTKELQKKLENEYKFIFIDGPVSLPLDFTPTPIEPSTNDWFLRNKDELDFFDSIIFDIDLLLSHINQYWDKDCVGLWGFSMGAHTSTLVAKHLDPIPEFVWLMGLSPIRPGSKLQGYDPLFDHLSGIRVLSMMGDSDKGKNVFVDYKKNYETMWYIGAHVYCSDLDAYDRMCAWLEPQPDYDHIIDTYKMNLFKSEPDTFKAVLELRQDLFNHSITSDKNTKKIVLDSNELITVTCATLGNESASIINGNKLTLEFPTVIPETTTSTLVLEFKTVLGTGLHLPCLKRQKSRFILKTFTTGEKFQFLAACTEETEVVGGKEFITQTYEPQSMEMGLFKLVTGENRCQGCHEKSRDVMNEAKDDMKVAKDDMKRAEEALNKWKESNPNFSRTNEEYIELKGEKEEKKEIYKASMETYRSKEETYNTAMGIYRELIKKIPDSEFENKIIATIKRGLDDNSSDSSKRRRNSQEQWDFRKRIAITCDNKCMVTGESSWEACHIIPHRDIDVNFSLWKSEHSKNCLVEEDGIDDIRNGVELCKFWHTRFDSYDFTVRLTDDKKYQMELSKYYGYSDAERERFERNSLEFSGNKDQWPTTFFLAHHNRNFEFKEAQREINTLKAQAEPQEYSRLDSDTTINFHFECLDYRKSDWIKNQPKEYDAWEQDVEMVRVDYI
ncbi:hypothetical protein HDV01_003866 [Terramyces sp. JEL0728]|nr:hypothetical protein HDV01_003866 [Terramyces sp. JEL0728]